ncbi:hypothetical protein GRFL_2044 [Christiangramia flava JLT2011]|uniref:Uncharacterized protein n=1 Tax=Christiangramia flava JLT2011 TaxID=1229726 RepID=A0A1L7I583_9FLAO|nr:hypothetical protein GRFL_2044 [Christiangramia flava JLT2011]
MEEIKNKSVETYNFRITGIFEIWNGSISAALRPIKRRFTIFSFQKIKELHETATIAFVAWNSTE